jgi:hypothetical protein
MINGDRAHQSSGELGPRRIEVRIVNKRAQSSIDVSELVGTSHPIKAPDVSVLLTDLRAKRQPPFCSCNHPRLRDDIQQIH